ncbi:hypothetical protein AGDE_13934 [Angomonas deanei]|uniref:Uncharacterized protein n=1 Tax=Angomonas deanei TaxID=59799 RepID=A0A7G2CPD8_9TRYP|nr:hypothetical protein AGDE_13934 [Angomonas deanei]CAD2220042.1 hypothetical protein, conserved [Angomonas deanei]|eukprot:EPY21594.1 hypothetical protein AGDE_13934 [Angomonas deanei]
MEAELKKLQEKLKQLDREVYDLREEKDMLLEEKRQHDRLTQAVKDVIPAGYDVRRQQPQPAASAPPESFSSDVQQSQSHPRTQPQSRPQPQPVTSAPPTSFSSRAASDTASVRTVAARP